jgi:molybdenum cofactor cytidylyltransferase
VTGKPIIASEYSGTLGVPALFNRTLFSELMTLKSTEGAKKLIKKHIHQVFSVPFAEGAIDIDTPKDYEQLQTLIE